MPFRIKDLLISVLPTREATVMFTQYTTFPADECGGTDCGDTECGDTDCGSTGCGSTDCGDTNCGNTNGCGSTDCGSTGCGSTDCGSTSCGSTSCGTTSCTVSCVVSSCLCSDCSVCSSNSCAVTLFDERTIWAVDPGPDFAFVKHQVQLLAAAVEARETMMQQNMALAGLNLELRNVTASKAELADLEVKLREALKQVKDELGRGEKG
jgi:hypothetical protein